MRAVRAVRAGEVESGGGRRRAEEAEGSHRERGGLFPAKAGSGAWVARPSGGEREGGREGLRGYGAVVEVFYGVLRCFVTVLFYAERAPAPAPSYTSIVYRPSSLPNAKTRSQNP